MYIHTYVYTHTYVKMRFFWLASYDKGGHRTSLDRVERKDQEGEDSDADGFEDLQVLT